MKIGEKFILKEGMNCDKNNSTAPCTVKSRFNESQFNVNSRYKVQNLMTKMEFHIKKSGLSTKSRFKE